MKKKIPRDLYYEWQFHDEKVHHQRLKVATFNKDAVNLQKRLQNLVEGIKSEEKFLDNYINEYGVIEKKVEDVLGYSIDECSINESTLEIIRPKKSKKKEN